jgi:hypothetical protein
VDSSCKYLLYSLIIKKENKQHRWKDGNV